MQTIYLDISNKGIIPTINAKQNDVGRKFCVLLFENGMPYNASENRVLFFLWYSGISGEGHYDTIFTKVGQVTEGRYAFVTDGNSVVVELATQMLTNAGSGQMCLTMKDTEGKTIGLWNIPYNVEEVPGYPSEETKPYYPLFENLEQQINNAVSVMPQSLTLSQQSQARANIDALQVPVAKEVTREEIAWVEFDDFSDQDSRPIYSQAGALEWLQSADDFDFRLITQNDGVVYELTKADCEMVEETYESGKMWYFLTQSPDGVSCGYPLIVANGVNQLTEEPEDSYSFSYMGFTPEGDYPNLWFYRVTTTERKLRVVTSVNGVEADENGNVTVDTMDDQAVQTIVEDKLRDINPVLTVNGVEPDENGNVELEVGGGSDIVLDATLTQEGQAADAKAVGDAIPTDEHINALIDAKLAQIPTAEGVGF